MTTANNQIKNEVTISKPKPARAPRIAKAKVAPVKDEFDISAALDAKPVKDVRPSREIPPAFEVDQVPNRRKTASAPVKTSLVAGQYDVVLRNGNIGERLRAIAFTPGEVISIAVKATEDDPLGNKIMADLLGAPIALILSKKDGTIDTVGEYVIGACQRGTTHFDMASTDPVVFDYHIYLRISAEDVDVPEKEEEDNPNPLPTLLTTSEWQSLTHSEQVRIEKKLKKFIAKNNLGDLFAD